MAAPFLAVTESFPNPQAFESESDPEGLVQRQNESSSWSKARWFVPVALLTLGILAGALHQGRSLRADLAASIVKAVEYRDQVTDSAIFSDEFKFEEVCDGLVYKVSGKYVEAEKVSSKYVAEEKKGEVVVANILERYKLRQVADSSDAKKHLKAYLKKLMQHLVTEPDRLGDLKRGGRQCSAYLLAKKCDVYYNADDRDEEGMPILVQPGDDVSPGGVFSVYVWKDGLKSEKV